MLGQDVVDNLLSQIEVWLIFNGVLDPLLIALLIGLGARAVHRGALSQIEHSKLDARRVDSLAHESAKSIDFANQMPFGHATNRWVAAHLADGVEVGREQSSACSEPCGSRRCFGSSVACAHDDDVVFVLQFVHGLYQSIPTAL